jgi:DNA polymerase-3 subunit beta
MHLAVAVGAKGSLAVTVPQRLLAAAIGGGRGAEAMIDLADDGDVLISMSGKSSQVKARTLPIADMPTPPVLGRSRASVTVSAEALAELIRRIAFAISGEETRYYLNGIYLHGHGGHLRAVATDGHRLAIWDSGIKYGSKFAPVIVHRGAVEFLAEACRRGGPINVEQAHHGKQAIPHLRISGDGWSLITCVIDGTFPDYQKVVPSTTNQSLAVKHGALLDALSSRPSTFRSTPIEITARNDGAAIKLRAISASAVEWEAEVPCCQSGSVKRFCFNSRYMTEAIRALGGTDVLIRYTDAASPFVVMDPKCPQHSIVLMPMRS